MAPVAWFFDGDRGPLAVDLSSSGKDDGFMCASMGKATAIRGIWDCRIGPLFVRNVVLFDDHVGVPVSVQFTQRDDLPQHKLLSGDGFYTGLRPRPQAGCGQWNRSSATSRVWVVVQLNLMII